jgi:ring-1,2-phenylacetyl-CoA epoxidase subunit PaaE
VPLLADAATPSRTTFHGLTVSGVERLCDDAVAVGLAVPESLREVFAFEAGQSLTVRRMVDGVEHRRSYSICAPVGAAPRIGVREVPGGVVSSWLVREVRAGDTVEVQAPTGSFRADPAAGGRHLCLAAGSGITPVLSIAASVLQHPEARVTLIYGNRTSASVMFAEELADLKDRHPARLELVHVLSREPREVELLSGRLDAARLRQLFTTLVPLAGVDHVWLCGPFGTVVDARTVLAELGVPRDRVHAELFFVDEPPPQVRHDEQAGDPIPGGTSAVTVVLDGRRTTTAVPRGRTVLDGTGGARHDLPYACRGGVCGTCRARVTDGEMAMRRNYALDEDEVARGFVLACQAVPVSDEVTVDFDA